VEEEVERVRLRPRGTRLSSVVAVEDGCVAVSAVVAAVVCEEDGEAESS
jgi:hypothetical protein